jgi:AraC-like DNA-binding protein
MVPLPVVVRHELVEGAEQATFPEDDEAVETLRADRAHEPLRVGVSIRRLDGRQHDPHPGVLDDAAESIGPLASRSQISQMRTRWPARNPSTASVRRRAACAINHASGFGVEPATVERIAEAVGFGDAENMRRAFIRIYGQPPQSIRRANRT